MHLVVNGVSTTGALQLPKPRPGHGAAAAAEGVADAAVGTAEAYGGGLRVRLDNGGEQRLAIVGTEAFCHIWHDVAERGGGALGMTRLNDLKEHATLLCVSLQSLGQLSRDVVRARLRHCMARESSVPDPPSHAAEQDAAGEDNASEEGTDMGDPEERDKGDVDMGDLDAGGTTEDGKAQSMEEDDVVFTISVGDSVEVQWGSRSQWHDAEIRGLGRTAGRFDVELDDDDSFRSRCVALPHSPPADARSRTLHLPVIQRVASLGSG